MMHSSSNYDPFYRLVLHRPRGELLKKQKLMNCWKILGKICYKGHVNRIALTNTWV